MPTRVTPPPVVYPPTPSPASSVIGEHVPNNHEVMLWAKRHIAPVLLAATKDADAQGKGSGAVCEQDHLSNPMEDDDWDYTMCIIWGASPCSVASAGPAPINTAPPADKHSPIAETVELTMPMGYIDM
ncbi:hypothetical protein NDA10_007887 [Ustilago hordei]|nr:hypothetical protein NDA10_007887 [Ustilago hordei]